MSIFLIALIEPDDEVWRVVREEWADHHEMLSDAMAFVRPPGVSTPNTVKERIGISPEEDAPTGIVVEISPGSVSGALPTRSVEWLRAAENG